MRKAAIFSGTTPKLIENHLFIEAYEASLPDGSIDFSGNSMKYVFVDEATKTLIEQYDPNFTFGEKETFHVKNSDTYMDLYGTGSGIKAISFADELLMKFRLMKAHLQSYFAQNDDAEMVEKIREWGGETVESISTTPALAQEKVMDCLGYYLSVNPYNTEAAKIVQRLQDDYPFDAALKDVVQVDS